MSFTMEESSFIQRLKYKDYEPDLEDMDWWQDAYLEEEMYSDDDYAHSEKLELLTKEWDVVADRAVSAWRKRGLTAG